MSSFALLPRGREAPQQTVWALDRPFDLRDFSFFEQSSRARDVTKNMLQPALSAGVQWALSRGATNVPTPSLGEIVVTLFDSSGPEPDEDKALRVLAAVMASTSINGKACIGDALREILRQRSPQSQRVRHEASLSAERASMAMFDELFVSPAPVRQPIFTSASQSVGMNRLSPPFDADALAARLSRLELSVIAGRLTAAAPPPIPTPAPTPVPTIVPSSQGKAKKVKPPVVVTLAPVPSPVVVRPATPSVVVSEGESDEEDDEDSAFDDLPVDAVALAALNAGVESAPSVVETVPEDERNQDTEALSPELYSNLLDHKRWPGMCKAHGRADVLKKFTAYYEEFTKRRHHDASAFLLVLRSSAAICECDLSTPPFKKIRTQVVAQIQLIIARFEFWRDEYQKGTVAAAAGEATLLNNAMPKHIQQSRSMSEKVAAKEGRAASAPAPPPGGKGPKKPGGKRN